MVALFQGTRRGWIVTVVGVSLLSLFYCRWITGMWAIIAAVFTLMLLVFLWYLAKAPFEVTREDREHMQGLEEKLKPKMELSHWEVEKGGYLGGAQFFRVCVSSTGGETVRSVQAVLNSLKPAPGGLHLPLNLHFSHDQNRNLTREDLNPGALLWVYVAALYENGALVVCSTVSGQRNIKLPVLNDPYKIGIRITAENSGYIDKRFQVQVKIDNRLHVVEVAPTLEE